MVSGLHLTCDIMSSPEWLQSALGEAEIAVHGSWEWRLLSAHLY